MSASAPSGDSALAATRFGLGVLTRPPFLWAPVLLAVLGLVPVLLASGEPIAPPSPTLSAREMADYLERVLPDLLPAVAVSVVTGLIVGPVTTAVTYRLAGAYIAGDAPAPFASGIVPVAVNLFLQSLVLFAGAVVLFGVAAFVLIALTPAIGPVVLIVLVLLVVAFVWLAVRLAFSSLLVVRGEGPVEALKSSWRMTADRAGKVFRWLFVSGVIVGILSAIVTAAVGAVFDRAGTPVAEVARVIVAAPFGIVTAIVITLLWRHINRADVFSSYPSATARDAAGRSAG